MCLFTGAYTIAGIGRLTVNMCQLEPSKPSSIGELNLKPPPRLPSVA